ncbi:MAG: LexA family transcriptional regulator [Oscillospiraceae bacterium]|nr:LexA family transcriptional regulator [Oscillospiraceae bacterium]
MAITDKLDYLMAERGITRGGLAKCTGIPYTTIVGFYEKGSDNIKLSNLQKLSSFFGVSLEYLVNDNVSADTLSDMRLLKKYKALSEASRRIADGVIDGLYTMEHTEMTPKSGEIVYIKEYVTPAAAGYASPAEGEDYILVPVSEDIPKGTDYAVRIQGDSMEPFIADGSRVFVKRTNELTDGDIGIFFVDGDMKCKQYCEDSLGNIYLFSLNRDRADADSFITSGSGICVYCFGKVLLDSKPPLPKI